MSGESTSTTLNEPPPTDKWSQFKVKAKKFFDPDSLDEHFPYAIPRTITVQDARMGISYYVLFLVILLFMFFYQMGYQGGHIEFESTFGQVSFQVKRPTAASVPLSGANSYWNLSDTDRTNSPAGFKPINQLPYCRNQTAPNAFCSDDPTNTSYYCKPFSCGTTKYTLVYDNVTNTTQNVSYAATTGQCRNPILPLQIQNCRYIDEDAIASVVNEKSIMILTRMSTFYQIPGAACPLGIPPGDNQPCVTLFTSASSSTIKYHTVQPEEFEIMFDHQVFTPTNGVTGTQTQFPDAPLVFSDGRQYYPAYIDPAGNGGNGSYYRPDDLPWIPGYHSVLGRHVISVGTLLDAGGIYLDHPAPGLFDSGSTYRYTGVTLLIQINYNNYNSLAYHTTEHPEYTYTVGIGTTYAALHQVIWNGNGATNGSRLFENRHGVKIYIQQEGALGAVSVVQLMLFFGSAAAFFGIASVLVDLVVIRFFVSKRTQELLDLASNTMIPTRRDLDTYVKNVEKEMGGEYEPPATFWEVEKEWIEQAEASGKHKARPTFKKEGAVELQKMLKKEQTERDAAGTEDKTDKELHLVGALAFARTISQPGQPELHRAMSTEARVNWKKAKEGVYAQVRAANKPQVERVRSALKGRKHGEKASGVTESKRVDTSSSFIGSPSGETRPDEPATPSDAFVVVSTDGTTQKDGYTPL
jgi:hypothetical protein